MDTITLNVATRKPEKHQAKKLRKEQRIPGVVYGRGADPVAVDIDKKEFIKTYKSAGENSIVDLKIDGKDIRKTVIQHIDQHPVSEDVVCVDFKEINMKNKIKTKVPVKIIGVAPAVKDLSGLFLVKRHEIEVSCLPGDFISEVEVDISNLLNIGDTIHVGDIVFPNTIEVVDAPDLLVAHVVMPKVKAEDEETEDEEGVEGEEGAEGAVATEGEVAKEASADGGEVSEATE